ncbi:MAG: ferritin-like protein [Alphaproteobacteria bacterium]|jgi:ferritin-like protein
MRLSRFNIVLLIGAVLSALWLFLAARYIAVQIGWDNLFFLLPHELGAFLAGVFMPLAFLWLALLVVGGRARVTDAADTIAARLDDLVYPPGNAEDKANAVIAAIEAGNDRLMRATTEAATAAEARMVEAARHLESRFAAGAAAVGTSAEEAAARIATVTETLDARRTGLISASAALSGEMAEQFDKLSAQEGRLNQIALALVKVGETVKQLLENQRTTLDGAAESVARRVTAVGSILDEEIARLDTATTESAARLDEQTRDYGKALATAAERAEGIAETYTRMTGELTAASKQASDEAAKIRLNSLDAERDRFLRASRLVLDDLNSLGVDLTRILDKPLAEKLWRQFARGDKAVFLRAMLVDHETRKLQAAIKQRYEDDADFRKYTDRYLDLFENLLAQASASDPESLLSSAFVTADVGKVYVMLSRAIGRMN